MYDTSSQGERMKEIVIYYSRQWQYVQHCPQSTAAGLWPVDPH